MGKFSGENCRGTSKARSFCDREKFSLCLRPRIKMLGQGLLALLLAFGSIDCRPTLAPAPSSTPDEGLVPHSVHPDAIPIHAYHCDDPNAKVTTSETFEAMQFQPPRSHYFQQFWHLRPRDFQPPRPRDFQPPRSLEFQQFWPPRPSNFSLQVARISNIQTSEVAQFSASKPATFSKILSSEVT